MGLYQMATIPQLRFLVFKAEMLPCYERRTSVKQGILGFVLGCVLIGGAMGVYANGLNTELSNARRDASGLKTELNTAHREAQQAQVQQSSQTSGEESKLQQATQELQQVTQARDTCQNKFARGTFLYETALIGGPTRTWFVPADVEPVFYGTTRQGMFSHYDLKTQMETVKFQAKAK